MPVCREPAHICPNDGNNGLRTGTAYACHILDGLRSLLLIRLHETVNLLIQVFDMDIQFIQMGKEFFHHPPLERGHDPVQVINDLLPGCFEVMGYDILLIHLIVLRPVNGFSRKEIFQDAAGALAIDV